MTDHVRRRVDGVTVEKTFDADRFPLPAVTFEINSERDQALEVTITDDVPPEVDMEQVGLHPDYHADSWTPKAEGQVEFNYELDPGESLTTIYGVHDVEASPDAFLYQPQVSVGSYQVEDAAVTALDTSSDEAEEPVEVVEEVADTTSDETMSARPTPSVAAEDTDSTEEDADEPTVAAEPDLVTPATDGSGATVESSTTGRVDGGTLVARLAEAVRKDRVAEEDLEALRSAIGGSTSHETRVSHLQSRVSDLEAYTDALEEFIDEEGTARQVLEAVEADIEEIEERIAGLERRLDEEAEQRTQLSESLTETTARVDTMEGTFYDVESNLDDMAEQIERLEEEQSELAARVEGTVPDLEGDMQSLKDSMSDVRSDVASTRENIEDLQAWRDQLTSVLSGGSESGD
ncbi:MAG: hypothetical protein ABEJ35_07045 [Halobacteriaceae archaeon]